jgi:hypothetical protein
VSLQPFAFREVLPLRSHDLKQYLPLFLQLTWLAAVSREGNDKDAPPLSTRPLLQG